MAIRRRCSINTTYSIVLNIGVILNNIGSAKYFVHYFIVFIKNEQALMSEQSSFIAILLR